MDFPSLYRQVVEDSKAVKNLVDSLNPDNNGGFGKNPDDGYFVSGLKITTTLMNENSLPSTYKIGVNYEIKAITAIGLDATAGFLDENCLIVTYRYSNAENAATYIVPFQVAYNSSMTAYGRKALTDSDAWDAWVIIAGGGGSGGTDFLESTIKPIGQQVGSFWTQSTATLEGYKNGGLTPYSYITVDNTVDGGIHVSSTSISSIIIDKLYGNTENSVSVDSPITLKVSKKPSTETFDGYTYNIYLIASDTGTYPNAISLSKNDTTADTLELDRTINQWVVVKRVGGTNPVTILLSQDTQEYLNCLYATAVDSYIWFDNIVKPTMDAWIPRGAYSIHPDVFRLLQSSYGRELQSKIVTHIGDTEPNETHYFWLNTAGITQDDPSMLPISTVTGEITVSADEPSRTPCFWFHVTSTET